MWDIRWISSKYFTEIIIFEVTETDNEMVILTVKANPAFLLIFQWNVIIYLDACKSNGINWIFRTINIWDGLTYGMSAKQNYILLLEGN